MILLRFAVATDAPELSALAIATFHDGWAAIVGEQAATEYAAHYLTPDRLVGEIISPDAHGYLLAVEGGMIIGYAKLDFFRVAHDCVTGKCAVLLQRLYVAAHSRGAGIADALLTGIEREAARRGYETLWLECDPRNARAWRFYGRRGFDPRAQVSYALPGGQNDEVRVMERAIIPAPTPETVRSTTAPP